MKKKIRPRFGGFIFVISSAVECTIAYTMESAVLLLDLFFTFAVRA